MESAGEWEWARSLAHCQQDNLSLLCALDELEKDHEFLTKGDVFTSDMIDAWITWKRDREVDPIRLRPHPFEFQLYYDA